MTTYHILNVENINIFYRESGNKDKPVMLLLHGFPSASHMFRDLIPQLSHDFHLIAPDYPGFGQSDAPDHTSFKYTFAHLTQIMEKFIKKLALDRFYLYVFDYGAPIGFGIASKFPDKILGIVSQNGNIYQEGLGKKWEERKDFWETPTIDKRNHYRNAFAPETIINQYTFGTRKNLVSPDGYTLDIAYTSAEGYAERQLDLIYDYQNNIKNYPQFQKYVHQYAPKLLAVWGKNDPSFVPAGAEAFKKDDPNAEVYLLDTGHFALETHATTIAQLILNFFVNS